MKTNPTKSAKAGMVIVTVSSGVKLSPPYDGFNPGEKFGVSPEEWDRLKNTKDPRTGGPAIQKWLPTPKLGNKSMPTAERLAEHLEVVDHVDSGHYDAKHTLDVLDAQHEAKVIDADDHKYLTEKVKAAQLRAAERENLSVSVQAAGGEIALLSSLVKKGILPATTAIATLDGYAKAGLVDPAAAEALRKEILGAEKASAKAEASASKK